MTANSPSQTGADPVDSSYSGWQLPLTDGIVVVVKESCPTCRLVAPVLAQLALSRLPLAVYTQDNPSFPPGVSPIHDTELEASYRLQIEAVPTLLRIKDGEEAERVSVSRHWKTRSKHVFSGDGQTVCRSSLPPRSVCCACWTAPHAIPRTWSQSSPRISFLARSRRWPSTPSWQAAGPSIFRW